jgi:hypothetical protein
MKEKVYLEKKTVDGKEFFYLPLGERRDQFIILWVSSVFVKTDEKGHHYIEFPVENCTLKKGKGRGLILKPGDKHLYKVLIPCGYRGRGYINEVSSGGDDNPEIFKFSEFRSPRGNLGIDAGALILTSADKVKVFWSKTGRLYGAPDHGIKVLYLDGRVEELTCVDEEELEMLNEELD